MKMVFKKTNNGKRFSYLKSVSVYPNRTTFLFSLCVAETPHDISVITQKVRFPTSTHKRDAAIPFVISFSYSLFFFWKRHRLFRIERPQKELSFMSQSCASKKTNGYKEGEKNICLSFASFLSSFCSRVNGLRRNHSLGQQLRKKTKSYYCSI